MDSTILDDNSLGTRAKQVVYSTKRARLWAFLMDNLLTIFIIRLLSYTGYIENTVFLPIIATLFYPFYKIILEGIQGQTIGKMIMNIKIVRENKEYSSINIGDANNRFLLWWPTHIFLLLMPLLRATQSSSSGIVTIFLLLLIGSGILLVGSVLSIFSNEKGKTWHDKIGGTICIQADSL